MYNVLRQVKPIVDLTLLYEFCLLPLSDKHKTNNLVYLSLFT